MIMSRKNHQPDASHHEEISTRVQQTGASMAVPYMTEEMYPLLEELADGTRLVSERDVKAMVRRLALEQKIVAEPSGALTAAAALEEAGLSVAIVTRGSIDAVKLARILTELD